MIRKLLLVFTLTLITAGWVQAQEAVHIANVNGEEIKRDYQVKLYPNPATDYLTIKSEKDNFEDAEFEVFSLIGSRVKLKVEKVDDSEYRIPVMDYAAGQYILIIKENSTRYKRAFKFQKVIR